MKKTIAIAFLFYGANLFCPMHAEQRFKSFLETKTEIDLYFKLCKKASQDSQHKEIEDFFNDSLKKKLALNRIPNKQVMDLLNGNFWQKNWESLEECKSHMQRTQMMMIPMLLYSEKFVKELSRDYRNVAKNNILIRAKNYQREDVVSFVEKSL